MAFIYAIYCKGFCREDGKAERSFPSRLSAFPAILSKIKNRHNFSLKIFSSTIKIIFFRIAVLQHPGKTMI